MLSERSLLSNFIRFSTATIASLMVFSLYSIVDGLFVARGVGEYAMSAVNLAVPFMNAMFSIALLFAVGTSTIIAIYLGEGKGENANSLFTQNAVLLLVMGVALSVLVIVFLEPFALLLGAEEMTLPYVKDYLLGLAPFAFCFMVSYNMEILVKTDGHPRVALLTVITGCLANCVLDYVAIFLLDWGIFGAAVATGVSQLLTVVLYLRHFMSKRSTFHFTRFRFDFSIYRRLLPIGVSDSLTELCNGVMIFLFNHTILRCIGERGLVSYTIIAYANTLIINTTMGISQGAQPLISFHYGRKDEGSCRKLLKYGLISAAAVSIGCFVVLWIFAPQLTQAFLGLEDLALNEYTVDAFRRYGISYLLLGFNVFIGGYLTARERPKSAIAISTGRGLIVQAAALLTLAATLGGDAIWFTPVISEAVVLVLSLLLLRNVLKR
ncbi:MAG: MATE family efflux transporter [Oscillospiraceae bacterium]|nr:MATE family efflux transporter [Oscillospiraceae bacterium]